MRQPVGIRAGLWQLVPAARQNIAWQASAEALVSGAVQLVAHAEPLLECRVDLVHLDGQRRLRHSVERRKREVPLDAADESLLVRSG